MTEFLSGSTVSRCPRPHCTERAVVRKRARLTSPERKISTPRAAVLRAQRKSAPPKKRHPVRRRQSGPIESASNLRISLCLNQTMHRCATNKFATVLLAPFPECRNDFREVRRRNPHSKDVDPRNSVQRMRQLVALTWRHLVLHGIDPFSISPENAASQGCRVFLLTRENHQLASLQRVSRTNTANSPKG